MSTWQVPDRQTIGRCEAATHLLAAREACRAATVALHATVGAENSPMWGWASEAEEASRQIDALRVKVHDGMWRNPNA